MKKIPDEMIQPMSGLYRDFLHDETKTTGQAESISFPRNEEEIRLILRHCYEKGQRVTVQGNRTGLTAGCVPDGGHILSLSQMDKVLGLRTDGEGNLFVRVQSGLSLGTFRRMIAGRSFGLRQPDGESRKALEQLRKLPPRFFPPDPTESSASLGGMAACNASGAKTFRYGPTRSYVEALRVVLPDGDVIALRRGEHFAEGRDFSLPTEEGRLISGILPGYTMPRCKNASGYFAADNMDLLDLFIGSDGTLGVLSELELRLIPAPAEIWGLNCFFRSDVQMLKFVETLKAWDSPPAAIEFFDGASLDILRAHGDGGFPVPQGFACMIYVEVHAPDEAQALDQVRAVGSAMESAGGDGADTWAAHSLPDRERLLCLRHQVPESVNALIAQRRLTAPGLAKAASDMAVPDGAFRQVFAMYLRDLKQKNFQFAIWGHIGNNHLHVNVLPHSVEEMERARAMFADWAKEVCALGGTVSAEHGAGKLKRGLLPFLYGDAGVREMAAVKRCFDPACVLGAGNLFPPDWV